MRDVESVESFARRSEVQDTSPGPMSTTIELPFLWVLSSRRTLSRTQGKMARGGKALVRAVGASKPFPEPATREIERVDRVCPALIAASTQDAPSGLDPPPPNIHTFGL